jgi:hypothetical protein
MFRSRWSWLAPLLVAAVVFAAVLLTTPPGFRAITDIAFGSPRGPNADAAAYALGSSASLALVALLGAAVVTGGIDSVMRRRR